MLLFHVKREVYPAEMKRTLQSVLLFIVTTIHALAWAAPNLKAECSGTPCANTLTGENPGQVAQRHSDELNATIRASDDDKKRWSRFVIYADSTALEDLQLELHKKSGLKLELFPSKGDLKFSRPGMAQIFHIAAPRKSKNDPCPEYDLKVLDASADHAVIRKTCPTYEYRPGRRYRGYEYYLYDQRSATMQQIWAASSMENVQQLGIPKPEPLVTMTPDGFTFKWKSEVPGSTGAGTSYNNIYTRIRAKNGEFILSCRDLSAPKGEEAGGTCEGGALPLIR
ncbi:MAG TPA: hypothetical protein VGD30_18340 [Telluria sp.]